MGGRSGQKGSSKGGQEEEKGQQAKSDGIYCCYRKEANSGTQLRFVLFITMF
jgi:hypothetical protein